LQLAAMSRVDVPEEKREDFYLYVDEFQNFATESFANILSEARKYRLNLIVAHQYIGQLVQDKKNTIVRDAIFGNVGTLICFRMGADDAEFLEKEFDPTYLLNDLVNLTKYHIYLKLMINGVSSTPFSATTLPPIGEPTGNEQKVIAVSRERYANKREIVEEKIHKWMGAEFHAQAAQAESGAVDQEDLQENLRYQERVVTGTVAQIRQSAPAAPHVDRTAAPAPRPMPMNDRRNEERREKQTSNHPARRVSDKKPAHNPVWETVNKLASEKLVERVDKATSALQDLGKSLEQSLAKPVQQPPASKPVAPEAKVQQQNLKPGDTIQFD
ncbi:MAG: type IV secretory system conjugative DNA transfer family protein, partial [bacterium]|nr:type IV secretory system conjugative DNA transfer family protein [bacterium]